MSARLFSAILLLAASIAPGIVRAENVANFYEGKDIRLIIGADVVIAIWRITPGEAWLATLFGNRVILPVTRLVYDRFADALFAWNKWKGHW